MNDILKQRLVGALILLALGVVFWPIIFVSPGENEIVEVGAMPRAPEVPTEPISTPTDADIRASRPRPIADDPPVMEPRQEEDIALIEEIPPQQSLAVPENDVAEPREPRTEAPEKLAMDSDGVPVAWTLQVATLSSADKADALRTKLLAMNEKAYISQVKRNGKTLYRVCIGPQFERAQLEKLRQSIDAQFGVNSLVARYIP